jgi:hypothetical protein
MNFNIGQLVFLITFGYVMKGAMKAPPPDPEVKFRDPFAAPFRAALRGVARAFGHDPGEDE